MYNLKELEESINESLPLSDIVKTFEKMCEEPIDNEMLLFETGTFSFTGESFFYFSLVRQFPNDDDEYYQIHVDVLFTPDSINSKFSFNVWNIEIEENFFNHIRRSEAFEYASSVPYQRIDIYMDET
ncbi:MAG: hypothetical protein IKP25_04470 [Ruminococcus sp.]|nr:hypothetical protein [Ruminococcus sp.]